MARLGSIGLKFVRYSHPKDLIECVCMCMCVWGSGGWWGV